jgi:hypothetical protein
MNVENATGINGANVKSGENGHKAVKNRERKKIPFGATNLLRLFGISDERTIFLQRVINFPPA